MKTAAGVWVLILALVIAWQAASGPQRTSGGKEGGRASAGRTPEIARDRVALPSKRERPRNLRAELLAAMEDPERLIELTPEAGAAGLIKGNGSLGYDETNILQRYQMALYQCSPEQLGRLFRALPDDSRQAILVKLANIFSDKGDVAYIAAVMRELPLKDEMKAREYLANKLGQSLTATDPDAVARMMSALDSSDFEDFAKGLGSKIGRIDDPAERMAAISAIFERFQNPELIGPLAGILTGDLARQAPLSALEWVSELPPGMTGPADRALMTSLAASHPEAAIQFGNELIEQGHYDRAAKALEVFAANYARQDARAAFDWALTLPADLSTRHQILWNTLSSLNAGNPERARQAVEATTDPAIGQLLQRIRQVQAERDQAE
jgi:hypothetical protein